MRPIDAFWRGFATASAYSLPIGGVVLIVLAFLLDEPGLVLVGFLWFALGALAWRWTR